MDSVFSLFGLKTTGIVGTLTLTKTGTTARTATFPDAAITVAGTNLAQTWTALQTFSLGATVSGADFTVSSQDIVHNQTSNKYMRLRRSDFATLDVGVSDNETFRLQSVGASSDTLGFYQINAGSPTTILTMTGTAITASLAVTVPNGTAAAPGIRLTSEASGLYRVSATSLGLAVAGVAAASLTSAGVLTVDAGATGGNVQIGNVAGSIGVIQVNRLTTPAFILASGGGGSLRLQQSNSATNTFQVADGPTGGTIYLTVTPTTLVTATDARAGIGAGASAAIALNVANAGTLTGTTQYGHLLSVTGSSAATTAIQMFTVAPATAVASFTCGQVQGFRYQNVTIGAGSSVTTQFAIRIDALSGAGTSYAFSSAGAGLVQIGDTTDATTTSDGSVRLSGGLSVVKSLVTGNARKIGVRSVTSAAGTTTLDGTDHLAVCTGSTTQTFTLPAAAAGRVLLIKNRSTGNLTVNRAGADTIDGTTTVVLTAGQSLQIVANGTDWVVL